MSFLRESTRGIVIFVCCAAALIGCNDTLAPRHRVAPGAAQRDVLTNPPDPNGAAPMIAFAGQAGTTFGIGFEANSPQGAIMPLPITATDNAGNTIPVICDNPGPFPIGTTEVTCSASDANMLTSTATISVQVFDTTPPSLFNLAPWTAEAASPSGAVVTYGPVFAQDIVSGPVPASCSPPSGSVFPLGVTTVGCVATDAAGNTAPASFDVTVVDTRPPSITVPASISVSASSPSGAQVSYAVSATDVVSGSVPTTCSLASGSQFPIGTTTVHCSAVDAAGNIATADFTVTVLTPTSPIDVLVNSLSGIINSLNIAPLLKTRLLAYVQQLPMTVSGLTADQKALAIRKVQAFIAAVQAIDQYLPQATAAELIQIANQIIAALST